MAKWSEIFTMTKRERIGALVVLMLILAAVAAQWAVPRCSREETPPLTDEQLSQFRRETDTSLVVERNPSHHHRHRRDTTQARARKGHNTSKNSSSKAAPVSNHRNDVVPNEAD